MVIVYTSNTGYTEQYAKLLSCKLSIPKMTLKEAKKKIDRGADIIYLGWLMASHVKDFSTANKLFTVKCLCGVGMAPSGTQLDEIKRAEKLPSDYPLFTLQGGFDMNKLAGPYKFAMKMLLRMVEKKKEPTEAEKWMANTIREGGNFVSADNLDGVLGFCRNM